MLLLVLTYLFHTASHRLTFLRSFLSLIAYYHIQVLLLHVVAVTAAPGCFQCVTAYSRESSQICDLLPSPNKGRNWALRLVLVIQLCSVLVGSHSQVRASGLLSVCKMSVLWYK